MTMGGGEADYHMGVRAEKVLDRFTVTKKKKKAAFIMSEQCGIQQRTPNKVKEQIHSTAWGKATLRILLNRARSNLQTWQFKFMAL